MNKYLYAIFRGLRVLQHILRKGYQNPSANKLRNFGNKKKCYILGNGPSLNNEFSKLADTLSDDEIFVVNYFAASEHYVKVKPSFYVLLDPVFFDNSAILDNGLDTTARAVVDIIVQKTDWPLIILTSCVACKFLKQKVKSNTNISVYGFNTYSLESNTKLDYLFYSHFYATPHIQNVIVGTIFLAINFGFKEINVLGFDHSWVEDLRVNSENQVCLVSRHFYDNDVTKPKLAPFYKLYGGMYKMHEALNIYAKMFYGYQVLSKYAKTKGSKIYNCTEGSYVDAFERKVL